MLIYLMFPRGRFPQENKICSQNRIWGLVLKQNAPSASFLRIWCPYIHWKCLERKYLDRRCSPLICKVNKEKITQKFPNYHMIGPKAWDEKGIKRVIYFPRAQPSNFFRTRKGKIDRDTVKSGRNDVKIIWVPGCVGSVNSHNHSDQAFVFHFSMFI